MSAKGQSQIFQFILFFVIGLALFIAISGIFKGSVDNSAKDISAANRELINNHFSVLAVHAIATCKECDNYNTTVRLSNTTAGSFTQVVLTPGRLATITLPGGSEHQSSAHNMLSSLSNAIGLGSSGKPIILSYSKAQNIMELKQ
jgi:hypothetical protein